MIDYRYWGYAVRWILVLAGVCVLSSEAQAWTKLNRPNACGFLQTFDGPGSTTVAMSQEKEHLDQDRVTLMVWNENWSIAGGDTLPDDMAVITEDEGFIGKAVAIEHGFALFPTFAQMKSFADSHPQSVEVKKGEVVIDRLNFDDFWVSFFSFEMCRDAWLIERAEKKRMNNIETNLPKDPFAK